MSSHLQQLLQIHNRAMPEVTQDSLLSHCYYYCLRTLPCLICSNDRELLDARDLKYLLNHRPPATPSSPPSKKRVCARRRFVLLAVIVLLLLLFITLLQIVMPARPGRDTVHLFSPPSASSSSSSSSSSVSSASKFWNCLPQFFLPSASSFFSVAPVFVELVCFFRWQLLVLSDLQIGVRSAAIVVTSVRTKNNTGVERCIVGDTVIAFFSGQACWFSMFFSLASECFLTDYYAILYVIEIVEIYAVVTSQYTVFACYDTLWKPLHVHYIITTCPWIVCSQFAVLLQAVFLLV